MSGSELESDEIETKLWSRRETKLLIKTRLGYENEFISGRRKKSTLWNIIVKDMKEVYHDFSFTAEESKRKFSNLLITYKRIKRRNSQSGRDLSKWEFYNDFDEVYGSKHFIEPPANIIGATLGPPKDVNSSQEVDAPQEVDPTKEAGDITPDSPSPPTRPSKKFKGNNEILEFLRQEAREDERRHKELMETEKERIEVLKGLKEVLQRLLE